MKVLYCSAEVFESQQQNTESEKQNVMEEELRSFTEGAYSHLIYEEAKHTEAIFTG